MEVELIGEFELDRRKLIGKGAWGEVYLGRQKSLNRPVAIKLLKKELTTDEEFVKRFRREAETLAKMVDAHIIQVYSAGEYGDSYYFIMEYVQGQPLSKFVERGRKFSMDEIVYVGESVARALKAAWESPAKIVHRDIKPSNIMVSYTSSVVAPVVKDRGISESLAFMDVNILEAKIKVMDFGLAKLSEGSDKDATMVGTVIGTPKYISPEQGMGNAADVRSDIYSLGIVLYEMGTGQIPFEAETAMSMIRHHIYDTATAPSQLNAEIPAALEAIIMKCIQKDPNKRYITPQQMLDDIAAFKGQRNLIHASTSRAALEATMVSDVVRRGKQKKLFYAAIAGGLLVSGAAVYLIFSQPPSGKNSSTGPNQVISPTQTSVITQSPEDVIEKLITNDFLSKIAGLIKEGNFVNAWKVYTDKIPARSRSTIQAQKVEKRICDEWLKTIRQDIIAADSAGNKQETLEKTWDKFKKVPREVLDVYTDFKEIGASLQTSLVNGIRTLVIDGFLAATPTSLAQKDYLNTGQKEFNYLKQFNHLVKLREEPGQYEEIYTVLDEDFINQRDEDITPAAAYFKMRILLEEMHGTANADKGKIPLDKIKTLAADLKRRYAASKVLELAQPIMDEALVVYEDILYNDLTDGLSRITGTNEEALSQKLERFKGFKTLNPQNRHLTEVDSSIAVIEKQIYGLHLDNYTALLDEIKKPKLDKPAYLKAFQKLTEASKLALKLKEEDKNPGLLDELKKNLEAGYLALCYIKPVSEERANGFHRFIQCTRDDTEMNLIPAGQFTMGDDNGEPNEKPAHPVTLTDYYIDKYEITNAQFEKFANAANYKTDAEKSGRGWVWADGELKETSGACWRNPEGDDTGIKERMNHPVVQISWNDAKAYAEWAGKRLPTEAEWEKAGRGTDGRIYPWGNDWQPDCCNNILTGPGGTVPVTEMNNGKSCYDCRHMAGNAAEWCADWYDDNYYQQPNIDNNPQGPRTGTAHTLRGGSWVMAKKYLKTTARQPGLFGSNTDFWSNYIGFRCVKDTDKELVTALKQQ